ncbi:MAG: radical SAM protein [Nitrospirae bacterium]|nr:radical SAM protein [Nitrospirota bacterium]
MRCVYCYSDEDNRHAADVPVAELFRIIDEFYALGTRIFMLQGGEPLLHPDIDRIIAYVKNKGAYCSITTNGVYLRKHLEALKQVDQVQLSIDGNSEITEANRGSGVYAALIEAMKLCDLHRIPFHLHTVLTRPSTVENTLDPLTDLANTYKTYLNFCIPATTGAARDKNLATNQQVHALYQIMLERKKRGMPTNNSEQGLRDIISWTATHAYDSYIRSDDKAQKKCYPRCVMGNLVCWLDSAGMLHPCAIQFGRKDFSYSIREHGVRGAWERLKHLPCHYCAGSTEFNNLFRFQPRAVINSLKYLVRRR